MVIPFTSSASVTTKLCRFFIVAGPQDRTKEVVKCLTPLSNTSGEYLERVPVRAL